MTVRPEPARADDEHAGGAEALLAGRAEAREGELAGVAGIHTTILAPGVTAPDRRIRG